MALTSSPDGSGGQLLRTSVSTQLQVLLAQKHAYKADLLQAQMNYLVERVLTYRAKRRAAHIRTKDHINKEQDNDDFEEKLFKATDSDLKITQEDSEIELKLLINELSRQMLGIGKLEWQQGGEMDRAGYGAARYSVNLSYPTSEQANSLFREMLHDAV